MTGLYIKLQQIIEEFKGKPASTSDSDSLVILIPPALRDILNRFSNIQDETQLKKALRQFLSDRQDNQRPRYYTFAFVTNYDANSINIIEKLVTEKLELSCVRIAEEIVEEDEPIISLIYKSLDPNIQYMDERFLPITLQEFTEYTDNNNKRRLKDFTHVGLSDDKKRIISYARSCEEAIADEKTGFCDQTEHRHPLTLNELERLKPWKNGLGHACLNYHAQVTGLWVTDNFLKSTPQENTLLYELKLLQESLRNGGNSRNNQTDHDLPSGKIADMSIQRFYSVWMDLEESERDELCELEFMYFSEPTRMAKAIYRAKI